MDNGQFSRLEIWDGRVLVVSAVFHADGRGSTARVAATADVNWLLAAERVVACLRAFPLQTSQETLVKQLLEDLQTSLEDYPNVASTEDDLPF